MQLTVYFESPFYVGVLEEEREGRLYTARHVFGAEPSLPEIYAFVLSGLDDLRAQMTVGLPLDQAPRRRANPKRLQREIRREIERQGVRRKAHEVMRAQIEARKESSRGKSRRGGGRAR